MDLENYQHHLEIRREIQARFWEKNKIQLNKKRRDDRLDLKRLRVENNDLKNQIDAAQPPRSIFIRKKRPRDEEPKEPEQQQPPAHESKILTNQDYCIQKIIEDKNWIPLNAEGKRNSEPVQCGGIKMFFHLTQSQDMNKSLQNYSKIEKIIREGKMKNDQNEYSLNSRRIIVQTIVYASDHIPGIVLNSDLKHKYTTLNELYMIMSKDFTEEKKLAESFSVMPLDIYLKKIMDKFGKESKEYLIVKMYSQVTARDNFHLYIVDRLAKASDKEMNYLVVPRSGYCTIILNKYKTAFRYKQYKKVIDNELTMLLRNYIKTNNIDYDHYLFTEQLLGPFIKKMNKEIGVQGSINSIRHIVISDMLKIIHP